MDNGHFFAGQLGHDIFSCHGALLVITTAGAEHVPHIALGQLGIGCRRGDHDHSVFLIDFGSGNCHAGVEVANHELHAVTDELVGNRHALLGIGHVVTDGDGDFLAENAACGIDVFNGLFDTVFQLCTKGRIGTGDGASNAELDLCIGKTSRSHQGCDGNACHHCLFHQNLPFK